MWTQYLTLPETGYPLTAVKHELEIIPETTEGLRYLEHGWPDEICRWHSHPDYELHLILKTRGMTLIGDFVGDFKPGSLYLVGPNVPHNWVTDSSVHQPVTLRDRCIRFDHSGIESMVAAFPELRCILPIMEQAKSGIEFKNFDFEMSKNFMQLYKDASGRARMAAFMSFLTCLVQHEKKEVLSVSRISHQVSNTRQAQVRRVIEFVQANYNQSISVSDAAEIACMSKASFARNFQENTGNSFTAFLIRIRIGKACSLLLETEDQVASICFDVGFNNLANFNRHFLSYMGAPPSEYRTAVRTSLNQ
jgi:AraC-like DNA-binding protein